MKRHTTQTLFACLGVLWLSVWGMAAQAQTQETPPVPTTQPAINTTQRTHKYAPNTTLAQYTLSETYTQSHPVNLSLSGIRLVADSGSLMHDVTFLASTISRSETQPLASNMLSVTAGSHAYRLLPHGEHFCADQPARIELAYEPLSVPHGFKPQDIHTYYFDEQTRQWKQLRRVVIDTARHVVISETTHFTDFVNAVIRTPDMPEVNAFVPTTLTDMEDPHPLSRVPMIAAPEANTYGTASITYPIDIPAGRNGLQPDLTLSYSSDRGNGIMGVGWSFPQPAITLDTRWGVPRYDANKETEIYTLNGLQLVQKDGNPDLRLPYQTNTQISRRTGDVLFIARDPKNADRIIRHGNSPKDYYWTVTDRSGTTYYYGKYATDRNTNPNCVLKDANGNIAHWALAEVVDLYGNYMRYEYAVSSQKEIYPKFIFYTGHRAANGTIDLTPSYRVFFHYDQRADIQKDGRLGFIRQTDSILCYIDVTFLDNNSGDDAYCWHMNHRYLLSYDESSTSSLLNQIQDHFNYSDGRLPTDGDCSIPSGCGDDLNTTTRFDYYTAPIENIFTTEETILPYPNSTYTPLNKSESDSWSAGGVLSVGFGKSVWNTNLSAGGNYNFSKSDGKTEQMLLDMNGDGLTDIVYIKNSHICFRPQRNDDSGVYFGDEINTGIPATGLSADVSKTHTWGLQAGAEAFGANANVSGGMSHSETYTTHYFADINGDGLPDYVADGRVYFNRINSQQNFLEHTGGDTVRIDSSQCATNFYYDGEVKVIPECYELDTIVSTYVMREPDCSLGYCGTEPERYENRESDYYDCGECQEVIWEYVQNIDLHSQLATFNLQRALRQREDTAAVAEEDGYDIEQKVVHCLQNCGYELVCYECWSEYETYLQYPENIDFERNYKECMRDNDCRSICPECYGYLLDGYEDEYLYYADTYCLNGMLQGMANPCDDCRDICIDDIDNCKKCIDSNPTCFVCDECQDICVNDPDPLNCNQCKLDYNCVGAIDNNSECVQPCLEAGDSGDYSPCNDCVRDQRLYCEECEEICRNEPEQCFACVNRHCHYDESEAYQNACWAPVWSAYNAWENRVKQQYSNVRIEQKGNRYYAHQTLTIYPEQIDPDIDAVRVWVAPKDGTVTLRSSLQLIQDTGYGRSQSRQADGVRCVIQLDRDVTVNTTTRTLHSQRSTILDTYRITENDYAVKDKTYTDLSVKKGDVFFFYVRSVRTHNYDNVRWNQVFTYSDGTSYSSDEDFICSSDEVFQTGEAGSITLDADIMCQSGKSAVLRILLDGRAIDSVAIHSSVSRCRRTFSYPSEASVSLVLHSQDNLGQIEVRPQLTFTPAQQSASNPSFSRWLTPQMVFTREVQLDSTYYHLFGPLYRGWGQFGYNNTSATDAIRINSLVNTAITYAETAPADSAAFCLSITFTASDTTQLLQPGGLDDAFSARNLYNPLDNAWIQMTPDASQYRWEAYGHVARNGRDLLSNTRDTEQELARMESGTESTQRRARSSGNNGDVEFDSDVPVFPDGQRATAVRKVSKTTQWNVNIGAGISLIGAGDFGGGYTHSQSDYTVTTDFMDMNGDGYPDVVRSASIQYTNPWGGLGENKSLATEMYNNHTVSNGGSLSGNYAYAVKAPGVNVKDGKFLTHVSGSVSGNATTSESGATIAYIDINGDGLPDKLVKDTKRNTISACLNIGYDFTSAVTLADLSEIDLNKSTCWGGSAGLGNDYGWGDIKEITKNILGTEQPTLTSKFQVSLAFGADMNWSENKLSTRLVDMNGDGIPDVVKQTDDGVLIMLMSAQGLQQQTSVSGGQMQCSKTFYWNVHMGITGGVPIWFVKICIGANGSPKGKATTQGTHDLIDMNGDGLPDLVWAAGDGIHIRYNQTGKNRLLRTVTNPTGQQFHIDYELSAPTAERRGRQWLMTRMCNIDPYAHPVLGCDTMMQQFDYADPHYDYAERQFLGYGATTTHDINTETTPHATYRNVVRRYNNTDFVEHGKLTYEGLSDAEDRLFHEYEIGTWYVDSTFTLADNLCADASIRIGKEVHYTRYYEGGEDRIVTAKRYEYDKYHNVREYVNMGDSVLTDDDLRATIEYDSTNIKTYNLVSSPSKMVVYSKGTPTREIQVAYQKGQPVEVRRTDLLNTRTDTTNYHYDAFGLPDSVVFPANYKGERAFTTVQYDAYSHTLPVRVADQWGRIQQMRYDKFLQLPSSVIDPSGFELKYEYDELGRISTISAPGDTTRKYSYNPRTQDTIYRTERNLTVSYSYSPRSSLGSTTEYPHIRIRTTICKLSSTEYWRRVVYSDLRGNVLYRKDLDINPILWRDRWTFSRIEARDCFGRTKTVYGNYMVTDTEDITLSADSLRTVSNITHDVLDRQTLIRWGDNSQQATIYTIGQDAWGTKRLLQTHLDENGHAMRRYFSPQGWMTASVLPDNNVTIFHYDALGQLLQTTNPDGLTTVYSYDGLGHCIMRQHPDAGKVLWNYDGAGNLVSSSSQRQINDNVQTIYEYEYNRLKAIHYPEFAQTDVTYEYDATGRVSKRTDITGYEQFEYDALGNISMSERLVVIPTERHGYKFKTRFEYDVLGRMHSIVYPDNEKVCYHYDQGKLQKIYEDKRRESPAGFSYYTYYIRRIDYDAYGSTTQYITGNNYTTDYTYHPYRHWLTHQSTHHRQQVLQDLQYSYDRVGNITSVEQSADSVRWLGGAYMQTYRYDSLYRLTKANMLSDYLGEYSNYSMSYSPAGRIGVKSCDDMLWNYWYGYSTDRTGRPKNHQVRSIYDMENDETAFLQWNADGQLQDMMRPCSGDLRHHWWNEAGQLSAMVDNEHCGYYGYDANGERVYKLTGQSVQDQYNAGTKQYLMNFNDVVLYANPYFIVTPKGYTKHYYNGSQRVATRIGSLEDLPDDIIDTSAIAKERIHNARSYMDAVLGTPYVYQSDTTAVFADIDGNTFDELQWQCDETNWTLQMSVLCDSDMLYPILTKNSRNLDLRVSGVYYYHPDHLGSATWITNSEKQPVQYIHYMPFGELWYNQQASAYNERFKFTGKERDAETGYDYFGARYYSSMLNYWTSPDKKSDKYPHISSYAYCNWNPIKYVDPDGNEFINKLASPMQIRKSTSLSETQKLDMIQTNTNLNTNLMQRNAIGIDNVFELFAHGSPKSVMNKLTRITDANQLNSVLCASSPYLNSDNNNSSVFIFYACNTGAGENSIAQQFSSVKEVAGSVVIAPTGAVSLDNNGMEYVKNGGEWRVFVDGVQIDVISGKKGMMTKYVKENMSNIDSFLKNCRQKILDGN